MFEQRLYYRLYGRVWIFRPTNFLLLVGERDPTKRLRRNKLKKKYAGILRSKWIFMSYFGFRTQRRCQKFFDRVRACSHRPGFYDRIAGIFETTLWCILLRSNFVVYRSTAFRLIKFGRVLVNGVAIKNPMYSLNLGDVVGFEPFSIDRGLFKLRAKFGLFKYQPMPWAICDYHAFLVLVVREPRYSELDYPSRSGIDGATKFFAR